jgi:hypothetical protein
VDAGDQKLVEVGDLVSTVTDLAPVVDDARCATAQRAEPPDIQPLRPLVLRI